MLKFVLFKNDDREIQYIYYPEGGTNPGIVSYDKREGVCNIVTLSKDDECRTYALKMFSRLRKYAETGTFKEEGMIAWY